MDWGSKVSGWLVCAVLCCAVPFFAPITFSLQSEADARLACHSSTWIQRRRLFHDVAAYGPRRGVGKSCAAKNSLQSRGRRVCALAPTFPLADPHHFHAKGSAKPREVLCDDCLGDGPTLLSCVAAAYRCLRETLQSQLKTSRYAVPAVRLINLSLIIMLKCGSGQWDVQL
ncbi:hypothetical protein IWZ03DRAFT_161314 [Phyllosticta citriasiana]|uniref:Secreted protein n=1 Tax=Phyllosticta citriasiana TaxID=595635 RepID=A0ABR1KRC7_9PEZI